MSNSSHNANQVTNEYSTDRYSEKFSQKNSGNIDIRKNTLSPESLETPPKAQASQRSSKIFKDFQSNSVFKLPGILGVSLGNSGQPGPRYVFPDGKNPDFLDNGNWNQAISKIQEGQSLELQKLSCIIFTEIFIKIGSFFVIKFMVIKSKIIIRLGIEVFQKKGGNNEDLSNVDELILYLSDGYSPDQLDTQMQNAVRTK
ncbi:hypothetical protein F5878DRAFT_646980 [Lentinula raphanica]|uniref:Uncharacterized protein n=1 Tax=Lentinula raphanica TaxID=153919 RepID=A0AA38NX06_9AGAR|nr:hypothetical protein F5880DRAFT_1511268 [Lentinula raphanica]KAJ3832196.1 hypothetical protein F5878DRAFT_646980 [Lentinula raphanica]